MKPAPNRATIFVRYPDGCQAKWQTRPNAPLATNTAAFAQWLRKVAEDIEETATTEGMCSTKR